MVQMIVAILHNKFDCFIVIEGNRGLGKSTLAYWLAKKVRREMKKLGNRDYMFIPSRDLLYTQEEVIEFFHKWNCTGIADEMINVTFNRDFYSEGQKNLIKMINMNRDHRNLFFACVPHFQNLDNQIKNLCKIRLTVVRRGIAVIQTPNRSIYAKDKWDTAVNEKIERDWMRRGKPRYAKLTTFRGLMRFPALTEKQETIYQRVKDEKRNIIAKEKGIGEEKEQKPPLEQIYDKLMAGEIRNTHVLDGMAFAMGLSPDSVRNRIRTLLRNNNKPTALKEYYWDNNPMASKDKVHNEKDEGGTPIDVKELVRKLAKQD